MIPCFIPCHVQERISGFQTRMIVEINTQVPHTNVFFISSSVEFFQYAFLQIEQYARVKYGIRQYSDQFFRLGYCSTP